MLVLTGKHLYKLHDLDKEALYRYSDVRRQRNSLRTRAPTKLDCGCPVVGLAADKVLVSNVRAVIGCGTEAPMWWWHG